MAYTVTGTSSPGVVDFDVRCLNANGLSSVQIRAFRSNGASGACNGTFTVRSGMELGLSLGSGVWSFADNEMGPGPWVTVTIGAFSRAGENVGIIDMAVTSVSPTPPTLKRDSYTTCRIFKDNGAGANTDTCYVATTGSPAATGDSGDPVDSLSAALTAKPSCREVVFADGTYPEQGTFTGGSAETARRTFRGTTRNGTIFDAANGATVDAVFGGEAQTANANYVTFRDLSARNINKTGSGATGVFWIHDPGGDTNGIGVLFHNVNASGLRGFTDDNHGLFKCMRTQNVVINNCAGSDVYGDDGNPYHDVAFLHSFDGKNFVVEHSEINDCGQFVHRKRSSHADDDSISVRYCKGDAVGGVLVGLLFALILLAMPFKYDKVR